LIKWKEYCQPNRCKGKLVKEHLPEYSNRFGDCGGKDLSRYEGQTFTIPKVKAGCDISESNDEEIDVSLDIERLLLNY